jgi:hypothetical protein
MYIQKYVELCDKKFIVVHLPKNFNLKKNSNGN